jgi:hypothetical protein
MTCLRRASRGEVFRRVHRINQDSFPASIIGGDETYTLEGRSRPIGVSEPPMQRHAPLPFVRLSMLDPQRQCLLVDLIAMSYFQVSTYDARHLPSDSHDVVTS